MNARGFTLIEMMVVVVIIGIMINYAVLSFGSHSPSEQLNTEATRLKSLIEVAEEEALMRSSLIGVDILEDGYGFLSQVEGEWQPVDDNLFRNRKLPDDVRMTLISGLPTGDDKNQPSDDSKNQPTGDDEKKGKKKRTPKIILLNSGEITPFELKITSLTSDDYYRLTGSETGELTLDKVSSD
jgi:general secretion pathway protein H